MEKNDNLLHTPASSSVSSNSQSTPAGFDTSTPSRLVVKFAILLSFLMFIAIVSAGLLNYNKNVNLILKNLQNQLQLAANTIAISIDGDQYKKLTGKNSIGTPEYRAVLHSLQQFMVNKYLGFDEDGIYTFRRISEDSLEFTVMLHSQYVGNRYKIRPEMLPTLEQGTPSYTGIYEDEQGTWVSAYAPITDSRNQIVGIVEVDFKNNVYLMAVKDEIYSIIIFSIVGIGIGIIIAIMLSRVISSPIEKVARAALQFSQGNLEVQVPETTRDEIGLLARAFNYMVNEVREKEHIRKMNQELREAYQRVESLNRSLQEANRLKSEFLSIAAHDLKNPLQVISGYAEMIEDTPGMPDAVYRNSQKISEATERMLKIISHLLDSTAIEAGKLKLKKVPTDLAALTREVVNANLSLARQKRQRLTLNTDSDCIVEADPDRMYEVINNLVSNAIKFSPPGKPIRVDVMNVAGSKKFKGRVIVRVRDRGPGLTKADMKKLFGKFARLSAQPTGGESSTGLGLSIVKQIVELHGGKVWAESKGRGKGSIFCVEL